MADLWEAVDKAWEEFEAAEFRQEGLWGIMDNLLNSGVDRGIAEKQIMEKYAGEMDAAIEKSKAAWVRWKELIEKAATTPLE
jgi:hypothetical protein